MFRSTHREEEEGRGGDEARFTWSVHCDRLYLYSYRCRRGSRERDGIDDLSDVREQAAILQTRDRAARELDALLTWARRPQLERDDDVHHDALHLYKRNCHAYFAYALELA